MRIAIVTYALQVGGVETFIRSLSDYFKTEGHQVEIIETLAQGVCSKSFSDLGYNVKQIIARPLRSRRHHALSIARHLSEFDAVILNDAPFAQASAGCLPDATVIITVLHNPIPGMLKNSMASLGQFDRIAVVSPGLENMLLEYGADGDIISCIPNGIRIPKTLPNDGKPFGDLRPVRLIYLGAINHKQKGVLYIPDIYKAAISVYSDIRLDIVGDGPDLEILKQKFSLLDLPQPIFHGALPHSAALALLGSSDVLLMPSHFEGLGLVMLEAMAYGVIPVVSKIEGVTDYAISNGLDGFLVPIGDIANFSSTIVGLALDPEKRRRMSFAASQTASSRFSEQVMAKAYLELIGKLGCRRITLGLRRNRRIDDSVLGDFPLLPVILVRPLRKILRLLHLKT